MFFGVLKSQLFITQKVQPHGQRAFIKNKIDHQSARKRFVGTHTHRQHCFESRRKAGSGVPFIEAARCLRNVDPRFVLAIARQESRFQTDAKSVAAARGMMQFISATADEVANRLARKSFDQDDLYNADTAILFGSEYLATPFQQFPAQPQAVAASYNGGPENVARWIARSRSSDTDRYVPEIGFSQTKDYVYKVMTSFWNYERLYDAQLERRSSARK